MADRDIATDHFDVAIIGYGPTGATLANLLAICGVRVLVLEREAAVYHLPRAVHFDDETMRVFQTVGIADALQQKVRINPGMRFVDDDGNMLMDWPRPQELGAQGWHASYRLHQPDLENLLRQALATQSSATIKTEAEVVQLHDLNDHVHLTYRDRTSGELKSATASYVVGCDGARSVVRQAMNSAMEDLGFRQRWLVIDVLLKHEMPELGDHTIQFCNPDRPMTYCRSPRDRRRWEVQVQDHETDEEICDPGRVWQLLYRWIRPEDAELERSAVYTFHSDIADSWRKNRLLIAGDAAHLTPPFMGQGMCAGIRDAANLAWKLGLCVQGQADPSLLDSYEAERSPHVREYITTAIRLGGLINALDRDSALAMAKENAEGRATMASIAPILGQDTSPLFSAPDSPHRGKLFPQPTLSDGRRMDDVTGYHPLLICRHSIPEDISLTVVSAEEEPSLVRCLDDLKTNAVLVRPDRYILATADSVAEVRTQIRLSQTWPATLQSPAVAAKFDQRP